MRWNRCRSAAILCGGTRCLGEECLQADGKLRDIAERWNRGFRRGSVARLSGRRLRRRICGRGNKAGQSHGGVRSSSSAKPVRAVVRELSQMGLRFRFWNARRFLGIFDLMLCSNRTRTRLRRGLACVPPRDKQVVEALLLAACQIEGLPRFGFTQQSLDLSALRALFEIPAAQLGSFLLHAGNAKAKKSGCAAGRFRLYQPCDAVGWRARVRTMRNRFPAPALSYLRGLERGT